MQRAIGSFDAAAASGRGDPALSTRLAPWLAEGSWLRIVAKDLSARKERAKREERLARMRQQRLRGKCKHREIKLVLSDQFAATAEGRRLAAALREAQEESGKDANDARSREEAYDLLPPAPHPVRDAVWWERWRAYSDEERQLRREAREA